MPESRAQREHRLALLKSQQPLAEHPETELWLIEQGEQQLAATTVDPEVTRRSEARKAELRGIIGKRQAEAADPDVRRKAEVTNAEKFGLWMEVTGMDQDSTNSGDLVNALGQVAHDNRDPRFDALDESDRAGAAMLTALFEAGLSDEERTVRAEAQREMKDHQKLLDRERDALIKELVDYDNMSEDEKKVYHRKRMEERYAERSRARRAGRPTGDDAA